MILKRLVIVQSIDKDDQTYGSIDLTDQSTGAGLTITLSEEQTKALLQNIRFDVSVACNNARSEYIMADDLVSDESPKPQQVEFKHDPDEPNQGGVPEPFAHPAHDGTGAIEDDQIPF